MAFDGITVANLVKELDVYKRQLHPHDLGADLLGQIILRGPQAAGENHDVRPAHRRGDDLLHPAVIVANCHLVVHVKAQHGAFFRQILGCRLYTSYPRVASSLINHSHTFHEDVDPVSYTHLCTSSP